MRLPFSDFVNNDLWAFFTFLFIAFFVGTKEEILCRKDLRASIPFYFIYLFGWEGDWELCLIMGKNNESLLSIKK